MGVDRRTQSVLDEYLVLASQAGDQQALEELARRWTPKLLRYAGRMVGSVDHARDIVQDTWAGVIRGLRSVDDPGRFAAWIYGIAHRRCIDSIRRLSRDRRLNAALDAQAVEPAHRMHEEHSIDLQRAIKALSADHREVVSLFYGEDLDVDEIASVLGIPEGTVKSRLFNARRQLRERFANRSEKGE